MGRAGRQIGLGRGHDIGGLVLDRDDVAHPVFERFEIALDVNVNVQRAGVDHGVFFENAHLDDLEKLARDRRLQDAAIDRGAFAQFAGIEFVQLVLKALEAFDFGIDREPAEVTDLAIVLVEPERHALEEAGPRGSR